MTRKQKGRRGVCDVGSGQSQDDRALRAKVKRLGSILSVIGRYVWVTFKNLALIALMRKEWNGQTRGRKDMRKSSHKSRKKEQVMVSARV